MAPYQSYNRARMNQRDETSDMHLRVEIIVLAEATLKLIGCAHQGSANEDDEQQSCGKEYISVVV
jgi:hypothetical protein